MKKVSFVALCVAALVVVVVFSSETRTAVAVNCNPAELSPCLEAIISGTPPSAACCSKLKEQKPCLCGYIKNPDFKKFIDNPNTKKVAATCGVAFPKC